MASSRKIHFYFILVIVFLIPSQAFCLNSIMNVRHWAAPDHTRIVFDTSEMPQFKMEMETEKLIIDFTNTLLAKDIPRKIILEKPNPCTIQLSVLPGNSICVEITFPANVNTSIFKLKEFQGKPNRLVIDLELPEVKQQETREREQVKVSVKDKIIVIDPGHGGEDPGAIGKRGTFEKDVVLKISKELKDILNKKKGYRAFLTRDGDYYVSFKERMTIAREYGADLFISIHADAAESRSAKGSSVYCLSTGGASSEAARILARNENLADLIGGSPNGNNSDESDPILLNMFQTNTINRSRAFGYNVLKHLRGICNLKFNTVQEAPFRVLKLPDIPSLLVETAYISNPNEELLLGNPKFHYAVAAFIGKAVSDFLSMGPATEPKIEIVENCQPFDDYREQLEAVQKAYRWDPIYVVKKGDNLTKIALRNDTTIENILKLNYLKKSDVLYIGRKLKVRETEQELESFYTVKEGDSLGGIALRHGTTLSALLKLNDMKLNDVIHVGRQIKIRKIEEAPRQNVREVKAIVEAKPEMPAVADESVYTVGEGDSLGGIALRHGTTLSALLKLNDMKLSDVLHVGRQIKIREIEEAPRQNVREVKAIAEAKPETPAVADESVYTVGEGDSLGGIALRHGTTLSALLKLNDMKLNDVLYVGQKIKIKEPESTLIKKPEETKTLAMPDAPSPENIAVSVYVVKKGDSLGQIAHNHGMTIADLLKLNHMASNDILYAGRSLKIYAPQETVRNETVEKKEVSEKDSMVFTKPGTSVYKVKKGDTLGKIALDHGMTISDLLELNNMKSNDILYAGRALKINEPAVVMQKHHQMVAKTQAKKDLPSTAKKGVFVYRVKKGDSLGKIAHDYGTTVNALLRLNDMKINDTLREGRLIKVNAAGFKSDEIGKPLS